MKSRAQSQSLRVGCRIRGKFGSGSQIGTILSIKGPRYQVLWDDDTTEDRHGDQLEPYIHVEKASESTSSNETCQVPGCESGRIHSLENISNNL